LEKYSDAVIVSWSGLKLKHLKKLLLCNIPVGKEEEEVACTPENKFILMSKSTVVDSFISSTLQSVTLFNQQTTELEEKK